jgi:hypothetical protein
MSVELDFSTVDKWSYFCIPPLIDHPRDSSNQKLELLKGFSNKFCFDDRKSYYKMLYSSTVLPCIPPQIYKEILQIRTVIEGV